MEPIRCLVCRQVDIGAMDWIDIATIFGFDGNAYADIEELPDEAQRYARSFQRGEITQNELEAMSEEIRTLQMDDDLTNDDDLTS